MSKINELRAQRAKTWEQTKAFLDSHRSDKGVLSAEDTATYEKMEQEIVDLGREIERQERLDAFERELNTPVNTPITQKPDTAKVDTKTGRASDTYKKAFWAQARPRRPARPATSPPANSRRLRRGRPAGWSRRTTALSAAPALPRTGSGPAPEMPAWCCCY